MPEYVVDIRQTVPPDVEICELTATLVDDGVLVYAKSPIIGEYMERICTDHLYAADYFNHATWKDKKILHLPSRIAVPFGGNVVRTDFLVPGRDGSYEPNMVWMRTVGLKDGVEIVFNQPIHVPADIIDFLSRSMDKARTFYLRYVRQTKITAKLREVS